MMSALSIYTVLMRTNSPKQPGCLQLTHDHKPRGQEREERKVLRKTNGRGHPRPLRVAGTGSVR